MSRAPGRSDTSVWGPASHTKNNTAQITWAELQTLGLLDMWTCQSHPH